MQNTSPASTGSMAPPPGPRGLPWLGNALEVWKDPLAYLLDGLRRYGPIARYRFAGMNFVLIADADAAHHVLVDNAKRYHKSRNYEGLKFLLGQGLLTSEGDFWRQQRKLAQPAFHRERLAGLLESMTACTEDMLSRWRAELRDGGRDRAPIDVHREMNRLTFRIVGRTLLGVELDGEARAVGEALDVALRWANAYVESVVRVPPWVPIARNREFQRAKRALDALILRIVRDRRAAMDRGAAVPNDLLQMLLEATDADTHEGMTDEQLKSELLTLVLAGHETTANSLAFTLFLLAKHPEVRDRVRREANEVLGERTPTAADLPRMPYALQVLEESLRLYPPAWIFEREALEDDTIGGYRVPRGSIAAVAPYVMHRNPAYFPDPERFDPERFDRAAARERPRHAYLPFGGGPRTCIGNTFALTEMHLVLPMIVRAFTLELPARWTLALEPSVTLRPAQGIPMLRALP
jgi:cytochrome P450